MKKHSAGVFTCAAVAALLGLGQEGFSANKAPATGRPRTTVAVKSTLQAAEKWKKACAERVAAIKGKPCDVIFVGDSITQGFDTALWEQYYGKRNALNFGVGADSIQNALWRLENMDIGGLRPKVVVVMLGMNNAGDSPNAIAEGVKAVISRVRAMYPKAKIVAMSVTANKRMRDKTPKINALLEKLGDNKTVFYCDVFSKMTPTPSGFTGLGGDGVHLNKEGYEIWASTLEPLLKPMLGEK